MALSPLWFHEIAGIYTAAAPIWNESEVIKTCESTKSSRSATKPKRLQLVSTLQEVAHTLIIEYAPRTNKKRSMLYEKEI